MSTLSENIKRINEKLQKLLKSYQACQKENELLRTEMTELKTRQENDLLRIAQLEQQVGILKSAAGKMSEPDKKIFEKQINQYIREIDKCISLIGE